MDRDPKEAGAQQENEWRRRNELRQRQARDRQDRSSQRIPGRLPAPTARKIRYRYRRARTSAVEKPLSTIFPPAPPSSKPQHVSKARGMNFSAGAMT